MNIPILTVYDSQGNEIPIPAIKGADGQDGVNGKSAYASAQDGGYAGTEAQFNSDLADVGEKIGEAPDDGQQYARKNKAWAVVQGGGSGAVIDDTAGFGDTDKAWSANKLTSELGGKLSTSGGTMTGDIRLNGARLYFLDTINMVLDGTSFLGMSTNYFNFGIKTKTARLRGSALRPTYLRGDESSSSELALLSDLNGKADAPLIKTTMDSVAVAGAQYYLGVQSAVDITMPTDAELGQEIKVYFKSGSTAATLTCDLTGFDFTPKANTAVLLTFRLVHKVDAEVTGDVDEWTVEVKEG